MTNTSQTIQSIPLVEANRGDFFLASFIDTLGASSTRKWSVLVGANDIHLGFDFNTSTLCYITFYINSNTVGFTTTQPFNNINDNSTETTDVQLVTGLTGGSVDGDKWQISGSGPALPAISGNGIGARSEFFVLAANSHHVISIKNNEALALTYSLRAGFYPILP